MIDMHSHILPNIDDGARTIEESIVMLEEAKKAGFTAVISTSHYIDGTYDATTNIRKKLICEVIKKQKETKNEITLYNGAEAYITNELDSLVQDKMLPTINDSRYLLMELPMNNKILYLKDIIYQLLSIGIVPIIAHPERYTYVQENPNMLLELIDIGVLFQLNYGSIIGIYGKKEKKTAIQLLKHNMIHFLGTDCHRQNSIYTKMDAIMEELDTLLDKDAINELVEENPNQVIHNTMIEIKEPIEIKNSFFAKFRR